MEILNENIPYYLINLFLMENFKEIFLQKNRNGKKFFNEFIYNIINILHLHKFDFKIEGFKIFLNENFLGKITKIFLNFFDDELILAQNFLTFLGNFIIELDKENMGFVFDVIGFNDVVDKFSEIMFKLGLGLNNSFYSHSSSSSSFSLKRIYLFFVDYLHFLSNFLFIYIEENKNIDKDNDNNFKNKVDIKKIILQVFFIIKYCSNNNESENNDINNNKNNCNNLESKINLYDNNMLINPFEDNTDINLNVENNNNNKIKENKIKQNYSNTNKLKDLKDKIFKNTLSIISYFSLDHSKFQIENGLINILKSISAEIKYNYTQNNLTEITEIKQILTIFKRISKLEINFLTNFFTEEIFYFVEEFYFLLNNYYNTKNANEQKKNYNLNFNKNFNFEIYTKSEKLNFNESLKSLFFYYSNIIFVNENFQINFIFDENKFMFILSLLNDKDIISKEVKYEIFYVFYNLFEMNNIRYRSFLAKKNIFSYLINFFKENFYGNKNKLRIHCNILCLSFIELFLEFGKNLTSSFNSYKSEIERESITDLIEQLQEDENIDVAEIAERIYFSYLSYDEDFHLL
jgi:hypothetical protein